MSGRPDSILDDLFHGCAWRAYLEVAAETGCWPDPEATRRRAFQFYEEALAEKNRFRGPADCRHSSPHAAGQDGEPRRSASFSPAPDCSGRAGRKAGTGPAGG
jgi:hypothetical protein